MLYIKECIIIIIMFSDLVLVWANEHVPLILYMSLHSVCDAEGLIKFSVSGMCVYCRCQE